MDLSFPNPGVIFADKYKIEAELGRGGFARVYRAMRTDLETSVAVKIMRPQLLVDGESQDPAELEALVGRFRQEARTISQLRSPQTVTMLDYGRTEAGMLYMVLEYIDGETLGEVLEADGALDAERTVRILEQVLRALQEAHQLGVLHRDIKPGNIMLYEHLGERDLVKVLDFGIGKVISEASEMTQMDLTADNKLLGTPRYLAPEYIRGGDLTPASDIYSLGLVTYELLTGERAIDADSSVQIIGKHLDPTPIELPRVLDVPLGLRKIVEKMAAKDPAARFASTEEVLETLRAFKAGQHVTGLVALGLPDSSSARSEASDAGVDYRVENKSTATLTSLGLSAGKLGTTIAVVVIALAATVVGLVFWDGSGQPEAEVDPPQMQPEASHAPQASPPEEGTGEASVEEPSAQRPSAANKHDSNEPDEESAPTARPDDDSGQKPEESSRRSGDRPSTSSKSSSRPSRSGGRDKASDRKVSNTDRTRSDTGASAASPGGARSAADDEKDAPESGDEGEGSSPIYLPVE
jgi:eukaryotic-like serine/threonine-protein kinase